MNSPQSQKLISTVWPKVEGRIGDVLNIRVGAQEITGGTTAWSDPYPYKIGEDDRLDVFLSGRFMAFEIASEAAQSWTLGTVDVEYRELGQW